MNLYFVLFCISLILHFKCKKLASDVIKEIKYLDSILTIRDIEKHKRNYADRKLITWGKESRLSTIIAANMLGKREIKLLVIELTLGYISPLHVLFFSKNHINK